MRQFVDKSHQFVGVTRPLLYMQFSESGRRGRAGTRARGEEFLVSLSDASALME